MYALTAHIAAFHVKAEERRERGGAAVMAELAATNIRVLRACRSAGFAAAPIEHIENGLRSEVARLGTLLDERREAGKVPRVPGALHLRHNCPGDGPPLLFDSLEFFDRIPPIRHPLR